MSVGNAFYTQELVLTFSSFFQLTKRQFPLLTHCRFYCSITQITYDNMTSHMTSKLSVNIVYFFANFVLLHSFVRVGQG